MAEETSRPERKKVVEFAQVESKLPAIPIITGLALILVTWVAMAAGGWFLYRQQLMFSRQLTELSGQSTSTVTVDTTKTEQLLQRIGELENRLSQVAADARRIPEGSADTKNEITRLQTELATTLASLQELKQNRGSPARLVAAINLRDTVYSGAPYEEELAIFAKFAEGDETIQHHLALLQPYAGEGIATPQQLKAEFDNLLPLALKTAHPATDTGSVAHWLTMHLSDVVQIRRVGGDVEGNTTEAILARAEHDVARNNFQQALQELGSIQGKPAETMQPWIERTTTYLATKKAVHGLYRYILASASQQME